MDSLQITNLRSLTDTGVINFKKINIFVGQNSSGKSTCIRALPLFKQSAQVKTISDILWYGPLVDFGSFEEALSRSAEEPEIGFNFSMQVQMRRVRYRPMSGVRAFGGSPLPISLRLILKSGTQSERISVDTRYELNLYGQRIRLTLDDHLNVKEFLSGNIDLSEEAASEFTFFRHFGLLPGVVIDSEGREDGVFTTAMASVLRNYVHGHKSTSDIRRALFELQLGPIESVLKQIKSLPLGNYFNNRVSRWTTTNTQVKRIFDLLFARDFYNIFEATGDHITEVSNHIQYVTPLRATAERYYRSQGLSVDEIDPQGRNLAMFLRNLSDDEANDFAMWTAETMGFEVRAQSTAGHVSVVLSDPGEFQRVNLADTGFGYSQVLPILAQLWRSQKRRRYLRNVPLYFTIEQPELHLHPRMQARLADLFVNLASSQSSTDIRLVIETHSESIINQLGKAVERGSISPEEIGIYIFEKPGFGSPTIVRESKFDEEGFLVDWPYGFFDAAE